jgi:ATP-dependent Lhr-like helicase
LAPAQATTDDAWSSSAARVVAVLRAEGALFFDELVELSGMLRSQVEQALAEGVALGLLASDSFNGLRALLLPSPKRPAFAGSARRKRRGSTLSVEYAGRWSLLRDRSGTRDDPQALTEHVAWALLRRYGVVCRALLAREARWLPPWRELLRCYHRLEAQGVIRGGRFVSGFTGEQFALDAAVSRLREIRRAPLRGDLVVVSACDPANLVGIVGPGERVPALPVNRALFRDGVCVAVQFGERVELRAAIEGLSEWQARNALLGKRMSAGPSRPA